MKKEQGMGDPGASLRSAPVGESVPLSPREAML
jgi:hypothetical protein